MDVMKGIAALFGAVKRVCKVEQPIGLELSDGDRAALYGWPDVYAKEELRLNEQVRNDKR